MIRFTCVLNNYRSVWLLFFIFFDLFIYSTHVNRQQTGRCPHIPDINKNTSDIPFVNDYHLLANLSGLSSNHWFTVQYVKGGGGAAVSAIKSSILWIYTQYAKCQFKNEVNIQTLLISHFTLTECLSSNNKEGLMWHYNIDMILINYKGMEI